MKTPTVFDAYSAYLASPHGESNDKKLTSVLVRFLVPSWGGGSPKGARATEVEIRIALDFLKNYSAENLANGLTTLEQALISQDVPLANRRTYRYIFNKFISWYNSEFLSNDDVPLTSKPLAKKEEKTENIRFNSHKGSPRRDWYSPRSCNNHGFVKKNPWALMCKDKHGLLIFPEDYINPALESDLLAFEKFRYDQNSAKGTVDKDLERLRQFFGWLHRFKNIPLEELKLTSIVPYCQLVPKLDPTNFEISKHIGNQYAAKQIGTSIAKNVETLVREYFAFLNGHPNTERAFLHPIVALAKFLYRDAVGSDEYPQEKDLPVVKRLSLLQKSCLERAKTTPQAVSFSAKSVGWETVLTVSERLRLEADTTVNVAGKDRRGSGVFDSLQDFLSVGFLTVIPPLRARTICELELGRTLIKGLYENNVFIPEHKMKNPETASWYIHLMPEDYKTGKTWGEWWGKIPNVVYEDNKTFYSYIDRWLTEGRNQKQQCEHNFFFRGKLNYKPMNSGLLKTRIMCIFDRLTGVPVTPKEFRRIYVTYLKEMGATEAELEAAAAAMQHSRKMQSTVYDKQVQFEKMNPVLDLNERIWAKFKAKPKTLEFNNQPTPAAPEPQSKYTRFNYTKNQVKDEVTKFRTMGMKDEQIINYLWDVTPKKHAAYKKATAELKQILS